MLVKLNSNLKGQPTKIGKYFQFTEKTNKYAEPKQ